MLNRLTLVAGVSPGCKISESNVVMPSNGNTCAMVLVFNICDVLKLVPGGLAGHAILK